MKPSNKNKTPLVYSCAGVCKAGVIANYLAFEFNKRGVAELAVISGICGGVLEFTKQTKAGRLIITIDGCSNYCCQKSIEKQGIRTDKNINLAEWGIKRNKEINKIEALTLLTNIIYSTQ